MLCYIFLGASSPDNLSFKKKGSQLSEVKFLKQRDLLK